MFDNDGTLSDVYGGPADITVICSSRHDVGTNRGRVMNGFATVTLTKDGGTLEGFINQDGTEWHS